MVPYVDVLLILCTLVAGAMLEVWPARIVHHALLIVLYEMGLLIACLLIELQRGAPILGTLVLLFLWALIGIRAGYRSNTASEC